MITRLRALFRPFTYRARWRPSPRRNPDAIPFFFIDGLPVDLVILLLNPANAGSQHLATLAALSRPLRNESFMQRLRQAPDAMTLHKVLAEP